MVSRPVTPQSPEVKGKGCNHQDPEQDPFPADHRAPPLVSGSTRGRRIRRGIGGRQRSHGPCALARETLYGNRVYCPLTIENGARPAAVQRFRPCNPPVRITRARNLVLLEWRRRLRGQESKDSDVNKGLHGKKGARSAPFSATKHFSSTKGNRDCRI